MDYRNLNLYFGFFFELLFVCIEISFHYEWNGIAIHLQNALTCTPIIKLQISSFGVHVL